jgi:hypothetical protein
MDGHFRFGSDAGLKESRMARLRVLAFALALGCAVPVSAEPGAPAEPGASPFTGRLSGDAPLHFQHQGFAFPVIDYVEPTGTRQLKRGIIAGKTIGPDALVGVGVFGTAPKPSRMINEPAPVSRFRRASRSAAIGLSMKF